MIARTHKVEKRVKQTHLNCLWVCTVRGPPLSSSATADTCKTLSNARHRQKRCSCLSLYARRSTANIMLPPSPPGWRGGASPRMPRVPLLCTITTTSTQTSHAGLPTPNIVLYMLCATVLPPPPSFHTNLRGRRSPAAERGPARRRPRRHPATATTAHADARGGGSRRRWRRRAADGFPFVFHLLDVGLRERLEAGLHVDPCKNGTEGMKTERGRWDG